MLTRQDKCAPTFFLRDGELGCAFNRHHNELPERRVFLAVADPQHGSYQISSVRVVERQTIFHEAGIRFERIERALDL
jgi:hypothetical protein